jgi:UDP-N-acetylglucosamine--N-acetylmuramyl-(pentapeptide) pyrophosphoryl-undecaprenol N-acetylglucosamine transferase
MGKRVILTTGGTGGHIFPALAVAEALRAQGAACLFVGSRHGPEAGWAAKAGLEFVGLPVRGVLGRGLRSLAALAGMAVSVGKALALVRRWKPDVAAGFGSYASCAPLFAAAILGVPVLVHEQNAVPGLTNRLLGRLAKRICLSLPVGDDVFARRKCVRTGNPVRASILRARDLPARGERKAPRLLVVGGSQGAKAINSVILAGLPRLFDAGIELRHQTGKADYERVAAGYAAFGYKTAAVTPFIDDMAEAYAWADLVLGRAGATSVAELAVAGKPALFIPFPYATHDHQTRNAQAVCNVGAAMMITEKELAHKDAVGTLLMLLADRDQLGVMSRAALASASPDAAGNVAREILEL